VTFSNTTPLFAFACIGSFELLHKVHSHLHIVETVARECEVGGPISVPDLRSQAWITIHPAPSRPDERFYMLDAGERDTLSAALAYTGSRVLIDERLGRNLAEYHGLQVVGSLGTLLKAHQLNLIPHFLPFVRKLQEGGFHYHEPLVQRLAALAGEV
jgi:predicted nucleic acid-binding protein